MTRAERVAETMNIGLFAATEATRLVSTMIAEEIEGYIEFLDIEGDLYGMGSGLRKAAAIVRNTAEGVTNV